MSISKELIKVAVRLEAIKMLTAQSKKNGDEDEPMHEVIRQYRPLLQKMVGKVDAINKLKFIMDNKRLRKPDRYWLMAIDKREGSGDVGNMSEWMKQLAFIFRNKLPVARILRLILDYGVENGYVALKRMLENDRARVVILKEEAELEKQVKEKA
jgi:hypothetical protein